VYGTLCYHKFFCIETSLEHGISTLEIRGGAFPQVSGIIFKYELGKSAGNRIREVLIAGKVIDPEGYYVVATNDFLAAGGDGYQAFGEAIRADGDFTSVGGTVHSGAIVYNDAGRWIRDVVVEHLSGQESIAPVVEGRIVELHP